MASIDQFTLLDLIRKVGMEGDVNFLREGLKVLAEALMDAEVSQHIGAERLNAAETKELSKRISEQGMRHTDRNDWP